MNLQANEISAEAVTEYVERVEKFHEYCTIEENDLEFLGDVIILEDGSHFSCIDEHRYLKELQPEMTKLLDNETILNAQEQCEKPVTSASPQLDDIANQATLFNSKAACMDEQKVARSERCGEEFKCNSLRALRSAAAWSWMPDRLSSSVDNFTASHVKENNLPQSCLDNSRGDCLANLVSSVAANYEATKAAFGALLEKETWGNIFSNVSMPTMEGLKNRYLKTRENVSKLMSFSGQLEMLSDVQNKILQKIDPWLRGQVLCQKWAAEPHSSECLEELESLDCLGCSEYVNAVCSAIGVIGSEGLMLFLTGGTATVASATVKGVVRISVAKAGQLATRVGAMVPELSAAARMSNKSRVGAKGVSSLAQRSVAVAQLAGKAGSEAFIKVKNLLDKGRVLVSPVTKTIAASTRIIGAPADFAANLGVRAGSSLARNVPVLRKGIASSTAGVGAKSSRGGTFIVTTSRAANAVSSGRAARAANNSVNLFDNPKRPPQTSSSYSSSQPAPQAPTASSQSSQSQLNSGSAPTQSQNSQPVQLSESSKSSQNSGNAPSVSERQNQNKDQSQKQNSTSPTMTGGLGRGLLAIDILAKSSGLGQEEVASELETIATTRLETVSSTQVSSSASASGTSLNTSSSSAQNSTRTNSSQSSSDIRSPDQARAILNKGGQGRMSAAEVSQTRRKMEAFYAQENRQKVIEQIRSIKGVDEAQAQELLTKRRSEVFKALDYMSDPNSLSANSADFSRLEKNAQSLKDEIEMLEKELSEPMANVDQPQPQSRPQPRARNTDFYPDYDPTPGPTPARSMTRSRPIVVPSGTGTVAAAAVTPVSAPAATPSPSSAPNSPEATLSQNTRAPASLAQIDAPEEMRAKSDKMESLIEQIIEDEQELPWQLTDIQAPNKVSQELLAQLKEIKETTGTIQGQYVIRERDGIIIHEFSVAEKTYLFDILPNGQARLLAQ